MKTLVLTNKKDLDGELFVYPGSVPTGKSDKYLYLVVCGRTGIDSTVVLFYTQWMYKAALTYRQNNPDSLPFLNTLSKLLNNNGMHYRFWNYEINGCVMIDNLSGTPRVESFGCLSVKQYSTSMVLYYTSNGRKSDVASIGFSKDTDQETSEESSDDTGATHPESDHSEGDKTTDGGSILQLPTALQSFLSRLLAQKTTSVLLFILIAVAAYFILSKLLNTFIVTQ